MMLEKAGILGGQKGFHDVGRDLRKLNNVSLFMGEDPDYGAVFRVEGRYGLGLVGNHWRYLRKIPRENHIRTKTDPRQEDRDLEKNGERNHKQDEKENFAGNAFEKSFHAIKTLCGAVFYKLSSPVS
jgi:hypothetical protein